jgi:nucleoside-diphosphate-sugar epimerase
MLVLELKQNVQFLQKKHTYLFYDYRCEELIIENFKYKSNSFDYIFLRLPDVIGPRDSTERFWFYQIWLQYIEYLQNNGQNFDIEIPKKFFYEKTSYVYVKDIARTVAQLLRSTVKNEIFNIGIL